MAKAQPTRDDGPALADLLESWTRALTAANRSPDTIKAYRLGVRRFVDWRGRRGLRSGVGAVTRADCESFISDLLTGLKPQSVVSYTQAVRHFLTWCVDEGEIAASPMERVKGPSVRADPPIILADNDLEALLRTCEGRSYIERRDTAILRMLIATPLRRGGLAGLRMDDVDVGRQLLRVRLKGGKHYPCPYDAKAALALDRYLRVRRGHPHATSPMLWLGRQGPMKGHTLYEMVRRRAGQAGLGALGIHPHLFRHTWVHAWLAGEGSERGAIRLAGWESAAMLARYGAYLETERAHDEYKRRQPGDRIK